MRERLERFMKTIEGVEILLVENPVDLYYLTGLEFSIGRLLVSKEGATLLVDGRYYESAKKGFPFTVTLSSPEALKKALSCFDAIGFDSAFVSVAGFESLQKEIPGKKWVGYPEPLRQMRLCKDAKEIELLRKAADVTWAGCRHAASCLRVGVSEEEIAWEFERYCREHGAEGLSFSSIIAFGKNSAYPHYRAGKARLEENQHVLLDVGAVVNHYAGDLTRIVFFGKRDPEVVKLYDQVRQANRDAIAAIRIGMEIGELDQLVRDQFAKQGVRDLYTHGLGHGIGLETHEYPRIRADGADKKCIVQPGMVFTIEPGLYLPGLGGIRWEDMILVTKTEAENLYHAEL
jgi:Xaa-Pro aminopeptidase